MTYRMTSNARQQSGFTLIEMMVVLVIMAIIMSSVVLSINTDKIEEHMEIEMRRIHALLNLAREEAILQGQEMSLAVRDNKYQFEMLGEKGWEPIVDAKVFREREVVAGTELSLIVDDIEVSLGKSGLDLGEFQAELSENKTDKEEKKDDRPRIFILSSGEIMPFELILRTEDQTIEFRVKVEEDGEVQIILPQDLG